MKDKNDLVKAWLRKAENDLRTAIHALETMESPPTDTICFHAQQCAEKYLKAFLIFHEVDFPYTHKLEALILLCAKKDDDFADLEPEVERLTPFAAEFRYPGDTDEVSVEYAAEAIKTARKVKNFVLSKLSRLPA
ncbi:MAG: HEPN domain-containing protein [bacterium]